MDGLMRDPHNSITLEGLLAGLQGWLALTSFGVANFGECNMYTSGFQDITS